MQRMFTRDERADKEEVQRAYNANLTVEAWRELKRQNELAHGDLTARFLASKGAADDSA